ncbi:AAA family ATPase [Gorillibacterium timonense]|uniref:AAA family ATPase n=1 Tax=Gorillibacterium timonense TaxID=1689269 RepID=UPI00071C1FEA|nr:AAA family ATPase [Gorillibacterium timonense]
MQKLVFFVGVAGTGKSTVAAKLAAESSVVFLDRDTVGGRFVEALLVAEGLDPDDRDSEFYKKNLRDLEYKTTEDVCIENLKLGQSVFMISPFTQELKDREWIEELLRKAGRTRSEIDLKVVVVILSDSAEQKERILARGTTRDEWKLEHWDEYWSNIKFVPEINWELDDRSRLIYDNSGELTADKLAGIKAFLGF